MLGPCSETYSSQEDDDFLAGEVTVGLKQKGQTTKNSSKKKTQFLLNNAVKQFARPKIEAPSEEDSAPSQPITRDTTYVKLAIINAVNKANGLPDPNSSPLCKSIKIPTKITSRQQNSNLEAL